MFFYENGSEMLEQHLDYMRVLGWVMAKYGWTGYFYDSGIIHGPLSNFWVRPVYNESGSDWGDWGHGCFIYPNTSLTGFVSSIRFELQRDGYEDYEYVATLQQLIDTIQNSKSHSPSANALQTAKDAAAFQKDTLQSIVQDWYYEKTGLMKDHPREPRNWSVRHTVWNHDPDAFYQARLQIAQWIEKLQDVQKQEHLN